MVKKSEDFSMEEVMQLAKSPAGQQLLAMLQRANPDTLQQVAGQAAAGHYHQAASTLKTLLSSDETQALMKQLGG